MDSPYCQQGYLPCRNGHSKCFPLVKICIFDIDENGHMKYCRNAAHLLYCKNITCTNTFKCPDSYCIPFRRVCDGVWDCSYGEDETNCGNYTCRGMLRCQTTRQGPEICLHPSEVCDSIQHCWNGEDELICNSGSCPPKCFCIDLSVSCVSSHLESVPSGIPPNVRYLSLERNNVSVLFSLCLQGWFIWIYLQIK